MKKLLNKPFAPIVALLWNMLLVYGIYQIARLEYFYENAKYFTSLFQEGAGDISGSIIEAFILFDLYDLLRIRYRNRDDRIIRHTSLWTCLEIKILSGRI